MKNKIITIITAVFIYSISSAQLINYTDSNRRVLVNGTDSGNSQITIHQEIGYWEFHDALNQNSDTHNGALQISDMANDAICARLFGWNFIHGSYPFSADSQSSIISSFTLASETTFKIDFSGMGHFTNNSDYLFFKPSFFLRSGITGSGGILLSLLGSGIEYITLPAGGYKFDTAIGTSYNCSNDPNCNLSFAYQSSLSITPINTATSPGENYSTPFLPDSYIESENPSSQYQNIEGAYIIRGSSGTYHYTDKPDGWFDIGQQKHVQIEVQSDGVITELQFPANRQGVFKLYVGDRLLGDFTNMDLIYFEDYSNLLDTWLITGEGGLQGVRNLDIKYRSLPGEELINSCGQTKNTSVRLFFDESEVTFSAVLQYPIDSIFIDGFEVQ